MFYQSNEKQPVHLGWGGEDLDVILLWLCHWHLIMKWEAFTSLQGRDPPSSFLPWFRATQQLGMGPPLETGSLQM